MKNNKLMIKICAHMLFTFLIGVNASAQDKDSLAVRKSVDNFVQAFNSLSWEPFRNSFTDDATIFYPVWEVAKRRTGRNEVESTWLELFPEYLNNPNKDSLQIKPQDIHIQYHGGTAVVTFHLGNGMDAISRRTLVMVKQGGIWKIAHLHASNMSSKPD